ncbi:MAG: Cys-tRNA(Pro) deacylase [Myxococcota bacterium]
MAKAKPSMTPAIRALKAAKASYQARLYTYQEKGGTRVSSADLGVDEHCVIKTLVLQDQANKPLIILMHGDRQVSFKALARAIGARQVTPSTPAEAQKRSGYQVGGTSPFGLKTPMPIYAEATVLQLPMLWINGGKRGQLVQLSGAELQRILQPTPVQASQPVP